MDDELSQADARQEQRQLDEAIDNLFLEVEAEAVRLRWDNSQLKKAVDHLEVEVDRIIQEYSSAKDNGAGDSLMETEEEPKSPKKPEPKSPKQTSEKPKPLKKAAEKLKKGAKGKGGGEEGEKTKRRPSHSFKGFAHAVKDVQSLLRHGKKSAALTLDRKKNHFDAHKLTGSQQFVKLCKDIKQTHAEINCMNEACTVQLETLGAPSEIGESELGNPFFAGSRLAVFAPDSHKLSLSGNTSLLANSRKLALEPTAQHDVLVDSNPMGSEADRWERRRVQKQTKTGVSSAKQPPPAPREGADADGGFGQTEEQVTTIY
jgi:hypothetical protein